MIIKSLFTGLLLVASTVPAFARGGGLSPTLPPALCVLGEECVETCEPLVVGGEPICRLACFLVVEECADTGGGPGGPGCVDLDGDNVPDFCPGQDAEPVEGDRRGDGERPESRT